MRFTPAQIATIRNLRACNVPWPIISREVEAPVSECRAAIGLPVYQPAGPTVKPWDIQRGLFDDQPDMNDVSDK